MTVISCTDNSYENWLQDAYKFVQLYKTTIDAYISNFFVEDYWNKLPKQWQSVLSIMDTEELAGLLSAKHCQRRVLPLSLLCFKTCTQTFSLNRNPVDLDSHKIQRTFIKDTSLHTDKDHKIPVPIQLEIPDTASRTRSKGNIKDGQYLPLNHCFRKHVKPKKQHEILQLGKLINFVCQTCGCKHVVDVGAGQGHLSRLLTFGHGLKVTTVEASGCHAPKAEKFDKDMSYTIRSKLKRKFVESETADYSGKTSNVDNLSLPDHVTCMIQPNTTPSEFLHVIQSQTNHTDEEELFCQCCEQTSNDSGNSQNMSDQVCIDCLKTRKHEPEDNKKLVLTGLHACGDLTPTILRVFSRCSDIKGVASVGCCYMKMTTSKSDDSQGYPMSRFVAGLPDHQLNYEAREMACHSVDVYKQRLINNPPHLKLHCYRAMLQEIILHKRPDFVTGTTKLTIKKAEQMEFEKYAKLALEKSGLDSNIDDDLLRTVQCKLSRWKDVVAFHTIRLSLAPVVESLILMDRMFYLKEQGISSYLMPVFDPSLSPRNFALVAYK